jgi:Flp pilus assembly protein TadG
MRFSKTKGRARKLLKSESGVAAIEFAIIAPVLVVGILGLAELAGIGYGRTQMHSALRSGAQYFMAGGYDPNAARTIVMNSWPGMPTTASVSVTSYCSCDGGAGTCNQLCPDQSYPDIYYHIEAIANLGSLFGVPQVIDENVRAR